MTSEGWDGEELGGRHIREASVYVRIADSLHHTAETNSIVKQLYSNEIYIPYPLSLVKCQTKINTVWYHLLVKSKKYNKLENIIKKRSQLTDIENQLVAISGERKGGDKPIGTKSVTRIYYKAWEIQPILYNTYKWNIILIFESLPCAPVTYILYKFNKNYFITEKCSPTSETSASSYLLCNSNIKDH